MKAYWEIFLSLNLGAWSLYLLARLLIADYFRHKEEFWDRIQIKMAKVTKRNQNAEG